MANTPDMNLLINVAGVTTDPTWSNNITSNFNTIDSHDHSPGKGVQITPAGMDITEDLNFNQNNATDLNSTQFANLGSTLTNQNSSYFVNGNFYINNNSATPVQITSGAGLNIASVKGIGGDYGGVGVNALVSYNAASVFYQFFSASGIYSAVLTGPLTLFNIASGSQGITFNAPSTATAYTITLPANVPGSQSVITIDNTGTQNYVPYSTSNVVNALVQRDTSGNFTAGAITSVSGITTTTVAASGNITTSASIFTTGGGAIASATNIGAAGNITSGGYMNAGLGFVPQTQLGAGTVRIASWTGTIPASSSVSQSVPTGFIFGVNGNALVSGSYWPIAALGASLVFQGAQTLGSSWQLTNNTGSTITYYVMAFYVA